MNERPRQPDPTLDFASVRLPNDKRFCPYACLDGMQGVELHRFDAERQSRPRLVGEVVPEIGVGTLVGESKIGKTFLAISLATSLATGRPFLGAWPVAVRDGNDRTARGEIGVTLYVAGEGRKDLPDRLQAAYAHLTDEEQAGLRRAGFSGLPIVCLDARNLSKGSCFRLFRDKVSEVIERLKEAGANVRVEMVVLDTASSVFNFADDNAASSLQPAMNSLLELAEAASVFVLLVSHPAKGGKRSEPRGSSVLSNSSDVVLVAARRAKVKFGGSLGVAKVRDRETPSAKLPYVLRPVEMYGGTPGIVAAPGNAEPDQSTTAGVVTESKATVVMELFELTMTVQGRDIEAGSGRRVVAVKKETLQEAYFSHGTVANAKRDTKAKYFNTALRELRSAGRIEVRTLRENGRNVRYLLKGGLNGLSAGVAGSYNSDEGAEQKTRL